MFHAAIALVIGGLALVVAHERHERGGGNGQTKKGNSPQDLFAQGVEAGRKERDQELQQERAIEKRARKIARQEYLSLEGARRAGIAAKEEGEVN